LAEYTQGKAMQGNEADRQYRRAMEQSVTRPPDAEKNGLVMWSAVQSAQGPILPPWGTRQRERVLRLWDRHEYNTLWQGAVDGLLMRWCATDWVIEGGKILANKYQRIFRGAISNEWIGWDSWLSSVARDFLRFDGGAWIEVIGPGDPSKELIGGITGLNHLDSFTTWPTGDPEHPCVYWDRLGGYHLMHRSRVIHLVDMPDGDVFNPGYGLSALSRTIAVVQRQLFEQRYIAQNLNDIPSSGVVIAENLTPEKVQMAYQEMERRVQADEPGQPGNVVWLYSMNPTAPADLKSFTFSRPPEKFDWDTYVRIDVNMMALAIGEDPQDLWPLSASAMGSGMQSEILAKKAKGKMYGHFLKLLERELNNILPESLEFSFKVADPDTAKKEAELAQLWAGAVTAAGGKLSVEEGRQLLADQVEAFNNVMTNEAGEMVSLPDTDVRPVNAPLVQPVTDPAPLPTAEQAPVTADDTTTNAAKDYDATRAQFVDRLMDLIEAGNTDEITRRRAGVVMRGQLNASGLKARRDGLAEGGVTALTDADLRQHALWLAEQSRYVTPFLDDLYAQGLSRKEVRQHAEMWANRSLTKAYYEGTESADRNGMYEFTGKSGKESCKTCESLQGTKMRMSEWTAKQLRPGVDGHNFECGAWLCEHKLKRVRA
jgi:hypothetical protein